MSLSWRVFVCLHGRRSAAISRLATSQATQRKRERGVGVVYGIGVVEQK